jgi:hypothetical protein
MGVYAHRFIEVIDKDNQWHLLPLWSKYKDSSYSQPDLVADEVFKIHFLINEIDFYYDPAKVRVVFFYA